MNVMNRVINYLLAAAVGLILAGCYNDYEKPAPGKVYTDEDFAKEGLSYVSIRDLKSQFYAQTGTSLGNGDVASWTVDRPLYTSGKVISTDRYGNVYKSIYLYDEGSESAIEVKLNTGNYLSYPVGRRVFVKLRGLVMGNYRGMISIGTKSNDPAYSNDNIENFITIEEHVFRGEQIGMTQADTLVVTPSTYQTLTDNDLGRLVRFERIESKFGKADWTGYDDSYYPIYFRSGTVNFDISDPGWENTDTWAEQRVLPGEVAKTYFYGSAWFTYGDTSKVPGNYVVRTSAYSLFWAKKIPANGTIVNLTAIYTLFTGRQPTYQLTLNNDTDVQEVR